MIFGQNDAQQFLGKIQLKVQQVLSGVLTSPAKCFALLMDDARYIHSILHGQCRND